MTNHATAYENRLGVEAGLRDISRDQSMVGGAAVAAEATVASDQLKMGASDPRPAMPNILSALGSGLRRGGALALIALPAGGAATAMAEAPNPNQFGGQDVPGHAVTFKKADEGQDQTKISNWNLTGVNTLDFASTRTNRYDNAPSYRSPSVKRKLKWLDKNCLPDFLYVGQGKSRDKNGFGSLKVVTVNKSGQVVKPTTRQVFTSPAGTYTKKFVWKNWSTKVCGIYAEHYNPDRNKLGSSASGARAFFPKPSKLAKKGGSWTDAWPVGPKNTTHFRVYLKKR